METKYLQIGNEIIKHITKLSKKEKIKEKNLITEISFDKKLNMFVFNTKINTKKIK
jgi:hypothetical protein